MIMLRSIRKIFAKRPVARNEKECLFDTAINYASEVLCDTRKSFLAIFEKQLSHALRQKAESPYRLATMNRLELDEVLLRARSELIEETRTMMLELYRGKITSLGIQTELDHAIANFVTEEFFWLSSELAATFLQHEGALVKAGLEWHAKHAF
jgi:hypothetical protein